MDCPTESREGAGLAARPVFALAAAKGRLSSRRLKRGKLTERSPGDRCVTKCTSHFRATLCARVGDLVESVEEEKRCDHCNRHLAFAIRARPRCWSWVIHVDFLSPDVTSGRHAETGIGSVNELEDWPGRLAAARSQRSCAYYAPESSGVVWLLTHRLRDRVEVHQRAWGDCEDHPSFPGCVQIMITLLRVGSQD